MSSRSGVTLTEVLVAIFIMGIGLLSLLVLFPLGALNMAQAIKDERVTMAAQNAFGLARSNVSPTPPGGTLPFYPMAVDSRIYNPNPNPALTLNLYTNLTNLSTAALPTYSPTLFDLSSLASINPGISYPVYVDPQGALLGAWRVGYFANATTLHPGFARADLSFIPTSLPTCQKLIARYLTVLDDMTFTEDGIADIQPRGPGGQLAREGRYTWAYMLRARASSTPPTTGVDVWVVVYEKRSLKGAVPQAGAPSVLSEETAYLADYTVGGYTATIHYPIGSVPAIKKGTWILDASVLDRNSRPVRTDTNNQMPAVVGGNFYRVSGVTDNNDGTMTLEFQTPVQPTLLPGIIPPSGTVVVTGGVMVVMDGVVEVFKAP